MHVYLLLAVQGVMTVVVVLMLLGVSTSMCVAGSFATATTSARTAAASAVVINVLAAISAATIHLSSKCQQEGLLCSFSHRPHPLAPAALQLACTQA
jgi:hypothetical protein